MPTPADDDSHGAPQRAGEGLPGVPADWVAAKSIPTTAAWLRNELDRLVGARLKRYSVSLSETQLEFLSEIPTQLRYVVYIGGLVELSAPPQPAADVEHDSELIAAALVNVVDHRLTLIDVTEDRLRMAFDGGTQLEIGPDPRWEAWTISSDENLLIVCTPGGGLVTWAAQRRDPEARPA